MSGSRWRAAQSPRPCAAGPPLQPCAAAAGVELLEGGGTAQKGRLQQSAREQAPAGGRVDNQQIFLQSQFDSFFVSTLPHVLAAKREGFLGGGWIAVDSRW